MVGQEHVLSSLIHALDQNRLHHAYLFTGTRGVGKTTVARIMAKCLNCEQGVTSTPCGSCSPCQEIDQGRFIDLIEIDAASRTKVEDTREILDNVQYAPTKGRFKVYLIDEVHMLSSHSFNALLKTLEEPPEHVKFLLATTEPKKLPVTVLSRCLQFYLKNIDPRLIVDHLAYILGKEAVTFEKPALELIARAANGSMRDAQSLTDQAIAFGQGEVKTEFATKMLGMIDNGLIIELAEHLAQADAAKLQSVLDRLKAEATDFNMLLSMLAELFFEVSQAQIFPALHDFEFPLEAVRSLANHFDQTQVQLHYQIAIKAKQDIDLAPNAKVGFEMAVLRMFAFAPAALDATQAQAQPQLQVKIPTTPAPTAQPVPQAAPAPTPTEAPPKTATQTATQTAVPEPTVQVSENGEFDWHQLVEQINLTGMAKQLASHSAFDSFDGSTLTLLVENQYANLASDSLKDKIQEAVSKALNKPVRLKLNTGQPVVTTPAQKTQQVQAESMQSAQQSIQEDEVANFIQANFSATMAPDSVKPKE